MTFISAYIDLFFWGEYPGGNGCGEMYGYHIINCYNKTHTKNSIFPICICHPKFVPYSDTKKIKELSDKDMSKADQHQEMTAFY